MKRKWMAALLAAGILFLLAACGSPAPSASAAANAAQADEAAPTAAALEETEATPDAEEAPEEVQEEKPAFLLVKKKTELVGRDWGTQITNINYEYNSEGELTGYLEEFDNSKFDYPQVNLRHEVTRDENGTETDATISLDSGRVETSKVVERSADGSREITRILNIRGEELVYSEIETDVSRKLPVRQIYWNEYGDWQETVYTYDENGKRMSAQVTDREGNTLELDLYTVEGNREICEWYNAEREKTGEERLEYDADGRLLVQSAFDAEGNCTRRMEYEYDANGNLNYTCNSNLAQQWVNKSWFTYVPREEVTGN